MYKSYFGWEESQKQELISTCQDVNNTELCKCVDDRIFKEYVYEEYKALDKKELDEFIKESKEECLDDSWF